MTQKPRKSEKLAIKRQTIRRLSDLDLTRAHGGAGAGLRFETETTCVTTHVQAQTVTCLGC